MFFVDVLDNLLWNYCLFWPNYFSGEDIWGESKPNCIVIIFSKCASHLENLKVVDFLNVVTHFQTLLHTVAFIITRTKHRDLIPISSEIVLYLTLVLFSWLYSWISSKVYNYRLANTSLGSETRLNISNLFPKLPRSCSWKYA